MDESYGEKERDRVRAKRYKGRNDKQTEKEIEIKIEIKQVRERKNYINSYSSYNSYRKTYYVILFLLTRSVLNFFSLYHQLGQIL